MASERSTIGRAGVCRLIADPIQGRLGLWLKMIGDAQFVARGTGALPYSVLSVDTCPSLDLPGDV